MLYVLFQCHNRCKGLVYNGHLCKKIVCFCVPMLYSVCPCCMLCAHVVFCLPMLYYVCPCCILSAHVVCCVPMLYYVCPCCIMRAHVVFCLPMLYSVCPCCILCAHVVLSVSMLYCVWCVHDKCEGLYIMVVHCVGGLFTYCVTFVTM